MAMAAAERLANYSEPTTKRKAPIPSGGISIGNSGAKSARVERPAVWGMGRRPFVRDVPQARVNGGVGSSNG